MMIDDFHMQHKICMVTGATAGIGKVTAMSLAKKEATLIITGRNKEKTEMVVDEICRESGNNNVDYILADFSDLDQVRKLAKNFMDRYSHLDVLVNNAGAFFNKRIVNKDGIENTFQVNYLAPFLLTNLLLGYLEKSQASRIINVSSAAHEMDKMDFENLFFERSFIGIKAYARSKLANLLFTYELARRLEDKNITVNAVHPGHVATDIWRNNFPVIGKALKKIVSLFALTPEEGADTLIYLATSDEVAHETGLYYIKRKAVASSPISYDHDIAQKLWTISEELTGLQPQ